jgi:hypothetical protein
MKNSGIGWSVSTGLGGQFTPVLGDHFDRIFQLNTNGKIVIQDWIMNDAKTEPVQGAIFSINMLVGVEGGDCYSENEVRAWLHNAGFSGITKVDVESGIGQVLGTKK